MGRQLSQSMNKKQIIVASESQLLYTTKRLLNEAAKLKMQTHWFNPYQGLLSIQEKHSTTKGSPVLFHRISGTRYDDFDLTIAQHFEDQGFKVTNPLHALNEFRSKDRQMLFFKRHQLSSVPTILYRGELNENYWEQIMKLSRSKKYVLKMVRGNQGTGVNLISGHQSLKSLLETFHALKDQKFLIQPFIEHKKEWRIFILKGEILGTIERRLGAEDFRGNSKRSKGSFIKKIPSALSDEALMAYQLSGLDYCGIDIMSTKDGPVFLEINAVPGFEQMEELSGKNIARELIQRII